LQQQRPSNFSAAEHEQPIRHAGESAESRRAAHGARIDTVKWAKHAARATKQVPFECDRDDAMRI